VKIVFSVESFFALTVCGKNESSQVIGILNLEKFALFATQSSYIGKYKKKYYSSFSREMLHVVTLKRHS
jgi:hypothetical protein